MPSSKPAFMFANETSLKSLQVPVLDALSFQQTPNLDVVLQHCTESALSGSRFPKKAVRGFGTHSYSSRVSWCVLEPALRWSGSEQKIKRAACSIHDATPILRSARRVLFVLRWPGAFRLLGVYRERQPFSDELCGPVLHCGSLWESACRPRRQASEPLVQWVLLDGSTQCSLSL